MANEIFAEANRQLNIKEVMQRYAGVVFDKSDKCCCPFHHEKTPSLKVYVNGNRFKCYGAGCGVSGDLVAFVAMFKKIEMIDAVKVLTKISGLNSY